MNGHKWLRRFVHLTGVLLTAFAIFECLAVPFAVFKTRHFRCVEVVTIEEPTGFARMFIQIRPAPSLPIESTLLPPEDLQQLRVGDRVCLMTADWNIKGPREQRVSLWRLITAYHVFIISLYPTWLLFLLIKKLFKTRPA